MRDASFANRAHGSGRETVATQRSSPNLRERILVSSIDAGSLRPARCFGGAASGLLGQCRGEILPLRHIHARVYGGLLLNIQLAESILQKTPRLSQHVGPTTPQNIMDIRGDGPYARPRFPTYSVKARAKRRRIKLGAHAGRRPHRVHRKLEQGPTERHRGIIAIIARSPQFPGAASIPFA